ncbi:MAG: hypothetical protein QXP82_02455 [Candidatus Aenigmatarchaeota archaeon]
MAILLIIVALAFLFQQNLVQQPVINFLKQNIPWSIPLFTYVKNNFLSGTLIGLLIFLVFANIPILPSPPAEAYIIFAFSKGTNVFGIIFITILVYLSFGLIYYLIGRFSGQRVLDKIFKKPFTTVPFLERFIVPIIFFSYIIPIPLPISLPTIAVLISGFYRTELRRVAAAIAMGMLFRVLIFIALYYLYAPYTNSYLKQLDKLLKIG